MEVNQIDNTIIISFTLPKSDSFIRTGKKLKWQQHLDGMIFLGWRALENPYYYFVITGPNRMKFSQNWRGMGYMKRNGLYHLWKNSEYISCKGWFKFFSGTYNMIYGLTLESLALFITAKSMIRIRLNGHSCKFFFWCLWHSKAKEKIPNCQRRKLRRVSFSLIFFFKSRK